MTRVRFAEESCRTRIRDQINKTGWWSSSTQAHDSLDTRLVWSAVPAENLSKAVHRGLLHVLSVLCVELINPRGQRTVRVVLECEEGVYYRDSISLVGQIQKILDWFGPVEDWPPVRISQPDVIYSRYSIVPQS